MEEKKRRMNIILGIILQIYFLFPWMNITGERKNFIMYVIAVLRNHSCADTYNTTFLDGTADALPLDIHTLAKTFTVCVMLYVVLEVIETIRLICNIKGWEIKFLSIIELIGLFAMLSVVAEIGLNSSWSSAGTIQVFPMYLLGYLAVFPIWTGIRLLMHKSMEEWEESGEQILKTQENDKHYKQERKRRLYFPGKYSKLYYHVLWHNFKYDWKDYGLLLFCGVIVSAFSFAGLGIYQMMAKAHRAENFLLGEGLGRILLNAMLPMAVCAIFLMVFVLVFYMKKWTQNYSVFVTLGIRKKALYTIIGIEIAVAFLCSLIAGGLLGNMIMFLFRKVIFSMLAKGIVLSKVTWLTYVKGTLVVLAVYIIALMATRDIVSDFNLVRASIRNIAKEPMPQRRTKLFITAGIIICMIAIFEYRQLRNHESMYLLFAFFAGIFLLIRFVGAGYLRRAKKTPAYLPQMLNRNHLYYKSKTTARYVLALTILNVCAVFYFLFQVVSVTIAEKPESLYPYDFVCIADDGDDAIFDRIKNGYQAKIIEYPMVRVANADKTEQNEGVQQKRPQGQQIGISESTYKQLKKYVDPSYKEEAMHLDRNGKKIYLVHQQDRSVKAQPVDWTFGKKKPFLHIGLPCEYYTLYSPSKAYPKRTIEGEEIGSLIGCFRQGKLENIVVFSDAYFKKAQRMWKYTNILTGDKIEEKALRIDGVTIKQGPTKLVLIQADPKYQKAIEKKMKKLEKNHTYEAQYDFEVHCWYSKKTAVNDLKTEYTMKLIINTFVLLTMTISGLFLMYIKSLSEMSDKKARADFLKCMGMRKKERVSLLKRELYYFYWLPELITIVVTSIFTAATFHARMYTHAVRIAWLKHAVWIWLMYLAIQWGFAWILGRFIIRKVEGKDE